MNDKVIIQDKYYDIVRAEGVNVILKDADGNEFATNAGGILLNLYIKDVLDNMKNFDSVENMREKISNVHEYLINNEAYNKLHSLLPMLILPENIVEVKVNELCEEYMRLYPSVIEPVEPRYIEPITLKVPVDDVEKDEVNEVDSAILSVEMNNVVDENEVFTTIREVNPMFISHDQKIMRSYLIDRHPDFEVNEEFTIARDPKTMETFNIFINDSGEPQMISTKRNLSEEIANTPALTDAEIAELENMSINDLRAARKTTSNLLKVNKINEIINARKMGSDFDATVVVDKNYFNKLNYKNSNAFGFISNLTISFLVGILGGVVLMVLGNLIINII